MSEREIVYWDARASEILTCNDMDEAIEEALDDMTPGHEPETIEVHGFARMEVTHSTTAADLVETVIEGLDEEYGDPEESTEPTQEMLDAAQVFLDVMLREYSPWACEKVETVTVNVREWIQKNRPDWLKETKP